MRKIKLFAATVLLGLALSVSVFAGHVIGGTGMYCSGSCVSGKCNLCGQECAEGRTPSKSPHGSFEGAFVLAFGVFMVRRMRSK